ncbi:MAG: metallophosphoesterase [Bacteroidota bacterium]
MRWFFFIIIYFALSYYAVQAFRTISKSSLAAWIFGLVSLSVFLFFIFQFTQNTSGGTFDGIKKYAFAGVLIFMVFKIVIVVFMIGEDIVRLLFGAYQKLTQPTDFELPSRRKFVSTIAIGIAAIPFASLLYGVFRGRYNFKVLKYELVFDDLPDEFDGYTIAQISDIHSGSFDNPEKVKYGIDLLNQQNSDAVMITGDLVNNIADEMTDWSDLFAQIKAKDGVFSILGNHDYGDYYNWNSAQEKRDNLNQLKKVQADMGWKLLLDEHHFIEKNNQKIAIVGVENWGKGGFKQKGDIDKAGKALDKNDFKILLSHDPSHWDEIVKNHPKNYQLTLSGHTHGMQFGIDIPGWFKWSPVKFRYKHWAGIYQEAHKFINVNRGFGYLAYPGRVGMWPEITLIKLRQKTS